MFLSIGGICLEIKSNNDDFMLKTAQEFSAFIFEKEMVGCYLIEVNHGYVSKEVAAINVIKKEDIFDVAGDEFRGIINIVQKTAKVDIADLSGVFNCFLRVFYSIILLENNGFLVHSVGLDYHSKGYLFAGASESGKTTTARMAKNDYNVLSDELVMIRQVNDEILLFSTPFNGEFEGFISSSSVPLHSISFLNKNINNGFQQIARIEMFAELMANIFFFSWDCKSNQRLINLVNRVCEDINGYRVDLFNYNIRSVINGISEKNSSQQSNSLAAG